MRSVESPRSHLAAALILGVAVTLVAAAEARRGRRSSPFGEPDLLPA